jgi:3-hydroxy-9,10-secoandrosta-1,3,5(10)-triene-9,17-dione monooxygenase reductase component
MNADRSIAPAVDQARFRQVLGHFPTGVTVVTATGSDGRPVGLAVGSFFSVSLDPPLVAFCAAKTSSSYPKIEDVGHFTVNVLAEDQEELCRVFASSGTDKFAGVGYKPSPNTGSPILDGILAWIDCEIDAVHEAGDHWIVIGAVRDLAVVHEGGPLVFFRGGYGRFTT